MKNKKLQIKISIALILVLLVCMVIIPCYASESDLWDLDESFCIHYNHSSNITNSFNSLIAKTNKLKTSYSYSAAKSIISKVKTTVSKISSGDYASQHREYLKNFESNGYYKYKYNEASWVIRNVLYQTVRHSSKSQLESRMPELLQIVYDISIIEMQNGSKEYDCLHVLQEVTDLKSRTSSSTKSFLEFVRETAMTDGTNYDNGKTPTGQNLKKAYQEYQKTSVKAPEKPEKGSFAEHKKPDDSTLTNTQIAEQKSIKVAIPTESTGKSYPSTKDYLNEMKKKQENATSTEKNYSIQNLFYTCNKNTDHPTWVDTRITLSGDNSIPYEKLSALLSTIQKANKNSYFINDKDSDMFIVENKILILRKEENVSEKELNNLFSTYETVGLKTMLKKDEEEQDLTKIDASKIESYTVEGKATPFTHKPVVIDDVLLLPVDEIAKTLGYQTLQTNETLTLSKTNGGTQGTVPSATSTPTTELELTEGSNVVLINGQKNSMKAEVKVINKVFYAEVTLLATHSGYTYQYNPEKKLVEFNKMQ